MESRNANGLDGPVNGKTNESEQLGSKTEMSEKFGTQTSARIKMSPNGRSPNRSADRYAPKIKRTGEDGGSLAVDGEEVTPKDKGSTVAD